MKNSDFIQQEILKRYSSVRAFAKEVGIPYTTLKSALDKEKGISGMAVEKVLKICNVLGIDINELDDKEQDKRVLTSDEIQLLKEYRKLTFFNRETVNILVKRMVEGCQSSINVIQKPLYNLPASAGTGQFLDSDQFEIVEFSEELVPKDTTFAVRVSGDSMEPEFADQSIVFVKRVKTLIPGDVGIFTLNNEGFIKELGSNNNLISYNPNYEDIIIGEYDDLRIIGKVVGKYEK